MDSTPLGKVFNEDNETNEEFIKFKKESSSKKWIVHSIKLERKKAHQGEIIFWKSIKFWEKRVGHQARKDFNQKKKKREIKLWENTNSSKNTRDMKFHKRSFKLRRISKNEDSSREKSNQMRKMRKRKKKKRHISSTKNKKKRVCSITSRKMKVH